MEVMGYDFKLLDSENTKDYYDFTYMWLTAGVIGRESEQNMALIGQPAVQLFSQFEDEKYDTSFSTMHIVNHLGGCIGFIERSDAVKKAFKNLSEDEWYHQHDSDDGEVIGLFVKDGSLACIRVKPGESLDDCLKLLSACIATSIVWSHVYDDELNVDLVNWLYYMTDEALEDIKDLNLK